MKQKLSIILFLITYLPTIVGMVIGNAEKVSGADEATDEQTINIEKRPGDNMVLVEVLSPVRVVCELSSPVHNMWSGRFHHLQTDQPTMIGWNMEGQNGGTNDGNVTKWVNLKPVVCEGDDTLWDAYQFWTKNANDVWECTSDPFRTGPDRFAGNGKVPIQSAIPTEIADAYLDPTGKYFQCWREVDSEVIPTLNTYRAICHFNAESATLAMRMPFRYSYLLNVIDNIQKASPPGVFVDTLGMSTQGRKLHVIRLEDTASQSKLGDRRTILMLSSEHSSEMSASWANYGALTTLLSNTPEAQQLRKDTTWLFILIPDPDGNVNLTFDNLTDKFCKPNSETCPKEILAYARYLTEYVNQGRTVDIAISSHNVEANECSNAFSPFIDSMYAAQTISFNQEYFDTLSAKGYRVNDPTKPWGEGTQPVRMVGYCATKFGSLDLCYEYNDRFPQNKLSVRQLQGMGTVLVQQCIKWLACPMGVEFHTQLRERLNIRQKDRDAYFQQIGHSASQKTTFEMLILGY